MIADLYHDAAHATLKAQVADRPGAQDFLKTAQFEDSPDEIPATAFAWPAQRAFPIHTPQHAVVSALYAEKCASELPPPVLEAIKTALFAYGVSGEVFARAQPKLAEEDPRDYLFTDGTYPVRHAGEVKIAEARLLAQADRLPLESRVQVFHKLAVAADRHGVTLLPASQGWGLAALSNPGVVMENLAARSHLAKTAELKEPYLRAAESLRSNPTALREFGARVKMASAMLAADKAAGLEAEYGKRLPDPMHAVFNHAIKLGAQMVDLGGNAFDLMDLVAMPLSFWSDALGPEFTGQIAPGGQVNPEEIINILPTLPADLKSVLAQALHSAGVQPSGV